MKYSNTTIITCPLCTSANVEITELPYPLFRHMDFSIFHHGPNRIGRCLVCNLVFRCTDEDGEKKNNALYESQEYVAHEEPHTLVVDGYDEPVPASFIQAKLLLPVLSSKKHPAILDIGCFDGMLLSEISKICSTSDLCGFDVAERPQFPTGDKFRFVSGKIGSIHGSFDLIILSHSIQYIQDIPLLFERVKLLLKPEGKLFIQIPDFSLKPATLLFGDLYYHYTPEIIRNMLQFMGFKFQLLNNNYFPRDILVIVAPGEIKDDQNFVSDKYLSACVFRINEITKQLAQLARTSLDIMGVLGTTIDAAFVEHCLGNRISFFVDENPKKAGTNFHGKPVIHPNQLTDKHHTILPYGKSGTMIKKRFMTSYQGMFSIV